MSEVYQLDDLTLRRVKCDELETLEQIASTVHFDIGLHNWKLYFSMCPEEFWLWESTDGKKIVGFFTGNLVNDDFFWGHHVIILPEHQKKNLFRRTLPLIQKTPYYATNRNARSLLVFRTDSPTFFGHKLIGFSGRIDPRKYWKVNPPNDVAILTLPNDVSKVDKELLTSLYKYDELLYHNIPAPKRRHWFNHWLFPDDPNHSSTVVAYHKKQLEVVGYGVGRYHTKSFSAMSPVYADSDEIAYAILCQLANELTHRENLYIEFSAKKRICFQFVQEAGLIQTYCNFRVYSPYVYNFPIEKQYADQEFWPL